MNAPVPLVALSGRVMQWLSSRPPGPQPVAEECEVGRVVADPDVFGQADRADRVEAGLLDLAVVGVADLRTPGQALALGLPPAPTSACSRDSVTPITSTPYSRAA